jgi:hypothetical protein
MEAGVFSVQYEKQPLKFGAAVNFSGWKGL